MILLFSLFCLFSSTFGESIDEILAPNAYKAEVYKYLSFWNDNLDDYAYSFDKMSPKLTFLGPDNTFTVVKWSELRENHENGYFNNFVASQLKTVLSQAKKLLLIVHGYNDGNHAGCSSAWQVKMAKLIMKNEKTTAAMVLCWNSDRYEALFGYRRNAPVVHLRANNKSRKQSLSFKNETSQNHKSRYDISTCTSSICQVSYEFGTPYYYHAASTGKVGEFLAKIVSSIKDEYKNINYFHGIGHSLGAHILGNIYNFGKVKLDRISGLDPAGPCFGDQRSDIALDEGTWGLTKYSAKFVDNIHTDGDNYGTYLPKGHLDFYAGKVYMQ